MDMQHALEIADESRDCHITTLTTQALIFLADHVRKIQASEEYWRFLASENAVIQRCELCAGFDTVIQCINGCHEK